MLRRVALLSLVAATIAITGCQQAQTDAPANNVVSTEVTAATANVADGISTGGTCGTIAGLQCGAATDFCKKPVGQCDVADAAGTCTTKPEICTKEYMPVCGCDSKTYGNACEAAAAGVSVQAAGACDKG